MFTVLSFNSIPLHHTAECLILDRRQLSHHTLLLSAEISNRCTEYNPDTASLCPRYSMTFLSVQEDRRKIEGTHQNEHLEIFNWFLSFWCAPVLYNWASASSRKNTFTVLKLIRKSLLLWQPLLSQARCWTHYLCHLLYEFEAKNGYHCNKMWMCERCEAAFVFRAHLLYSAYLVL